LDWIDETAALTADEFATFFQNKFESVHSSTPLYDVPYKTTVTLDAWTAVTADEVEKLIGSALCKTCQIDPALTWLVKDVRGLLSPFIALLFNRSLVDGCFLSEFKKAVVRLLLKKSGLDANQPQNDRPVSNLSFLSKLLEKVVQARFQSFLDSNNPTPTTQSAYRQFYSTETAVTKMYNDLYIISTSLSHSLS